MYTLTGNQIYTLNDIRRSIPEHPTTMRVQRKLWDMGHYMPYFPYYSPHMDGRFDNYDKMHMDDNIFAVSVSDPDLPYLDSFIETSA